MSSFASVVKNLRYTLKLNGSHKTIIELPFGRTVGGPNPWIVAGPCSLESASIMEDVAKGLPLGEMGGIRAGVFKPRTSPFSFQGLGYEGLPILDSFRTSHQVPLVVEVMAVDQIPILAEVVDVLQVGSRNMQNYPLLKELSKLRKPILLKRGLSATLEELLLAAEYLMQDGNTQIILCERGIRSFDNFTRNVLDLGAVATLKEITHLPVVVDPSHGTGRRELILPMSRAAIACGADGLLVECHPSPDESITDAAQAITLSMMKKIVDQVTILAEVHSIMNIPEPERKKRESAVFFS